MRLPAILLIITFTAGCTAQDSLFAREWTYASRTSAVIYWQLADIAEAATSYVEYGPSDALGSRTEATREARGAQFHRLTGLAPESSYSYRLVTIDAAGNETRSPIRTLATIAMPEAIPVPGDLPGPPYILDQPGATYILTGDVSAPGGVFVIEAPDITLDLDGHTVTFGNDTDGQVQGVLAACEGPATICNGHIVQGARCKDYSTAVSSRWRPQPTEIFGISTDVYLRCGYPVKFLGAAKGARIHHNRLYSRVTEIESRHYPGNDLLRLDIDGGDCEISDNILTEGCHVGLRLTGKGPDVSVHHNDIRHHQQYVNGYAIAASCAGADIHHNRVTSTGRGIHLTAEGIDLHDNHLDLRGHQHLSDMPQGTRPWQTRRVELHGIKFEGAGVKNCRVHDNRVRITQPLPTGADGAGQVEDKRLTGVYVRSEATALAESALTDETQDWETDRWKGYFVKYSPDQPAAEIAGNDATTLHADFAEAPAGEYTIYAKWDWVPATPLNIACYDPNAMNEVFGNTFIALTEYPTTRHGGYGDSGQWASSVHFVGMQKGPAERGKYSIYIHDNEFISNDLFASSSAPVDMTIRTEGNTFHLADAPPPTEARTDFRRLGDALTNQLALP